MWVALMAPYPIACTRNTEMMLILFEVFFSLLRTYSIYLGILYM